MDVTRVSAEHELQFESPVKADLRVERALRRDHRLVQHELVAPVVKEPAEVLIVFRRIDVSGKTGLDPSVNGQARLRLFLFDEIFLGVFLRRSECLRRHPDGRERKEKSGSQSGRHSERSRGIQSWNLHVMLRDPSTSLGMTALRRVEYHNQSG